MDSSITSQNTAEDKGQKIRQGFLKYPAETAEVDYKDAVKFVSGESFALKIVKHILGMANSGGGYIVIGYPEGNTKHPEAGVVSQDVLASYDISSLASCVEGYKAGTEKIDIYVHKEKHADTGVIYPIIEVRGFKNRPFFCKSTAGGILEKDALYIRIAGARTIKVATPDEWEKLMDLCISRRQDEMIKRFGALMRDIGLTNLSEVNSEDKSKKKIERWRDEVRKDAKAIAEARGFKFEGWEITHSFSDYTRKTWDVKALLNAMTTATLRNTGWPIGHVFHVSEYKPEMYKKGLRATVAPKDKNPLFRESFDYWFIDTDGSFYYFRAFEEDSEGADSGRVSFPPLPKRQVWFDTQIWRISECLEHTLSLCKALGIDSMQKISVRLSYLGTKDRTLLTSPGTSRHLYPHKTTTDSFEWEETISLDSLGLTMDQSIKKIGNKFFMIFDFMELSEAVIQSVIDEYRKSRTS